MDETALVRHPTRIRGYVAKFSASQQKAVDRATLGDRRTCMSYFACVTHDAGVQGQLPQVVLGNERQVSKALLDTIAGKLPANMVCWRLKSSWNSHETMRKWLSLLAKSLGNLVRDRTVILLVNVNPSHIHQSIFVHARRCGIRLVYVPAKLTAYLQPCDTHVFAKFKRSFRDIWRERRSNLPGGVVTDLCWLEIVFEAIQTALATASWRGAFLSTGILEQQRRVSNRLRGAFGFARGVEFGDNPLTAEEASAIFPKRSKADHLSYVLWQPKSHRLQKSVGKLGLALSPHLVHPSGGSYLQPLEQRRAPLIETAEGLPTRPRFNVPFVGPKMDARSTLLGHVCSRSLPLTRQVCDVGPETNCQTVYGPKRSSSL